MNFFGNTHLHTVRKTRVDQQKVSQVVCDLRVRSVGSGQRNEFEGAA